MRLSPSLVIVMESVVCTRFEGGHLDYLLSGDAMSANVEPPMGLARSLEAFELQFIPFSEADDAENSFPNAAMPRCSTFKSRSNSNRALLALHECIMAMDQT